MRRLHVRVNWRTNYMGARWVLFVAGISYYAAVVLPKVVYHS